MKPLKGNQRLRSVSRSHPVMLQALEPKSSPRRRRGLDASTDRGLTERSGEVFSLDILSHRMSEIARTLGTEPGSSRNRRQRLRMSLKQPMQTCTFRKGGSKRFRNTRSPSQVMTACNLVWRRGSRNLRQKRFGNPPVSSVQKVIDAACWETALYTDEDGLAFAPLLGGHEPPFP